MKRDPKKDQARHSQQGGKAALNRPLAQPKRSAKTRLLVGVGIALALSAAAFIWLRGGKSSALEKYSPRPPGDLAFTRDVAPIIFEHCAYCHHPGQSAPFSLLNFSDVKKHAIEIGEATARRYMPPWLPERGYGEFVGERRLSVEQLGILQQWIAEGAKEGNPADLPKPPVWAGDWQLGQPDLVVTMPRPFHLPAEGRDVYRNFVIPVPISEKRYVKAIEFRPGNAKVVHHAFFKVDRTGQASRLEQQNTEPGFPGMMAPAEMPDGHFLGWQPGRMPVVSPQGLPWELDPGNNLVLQMHFNSSGKPEVLQSSVGLYFTDRPATNTCFKMALTSLAMDIPPGATDYVVEDTFVLPVDLEVLGVLPHAHYLAKEMQGWATLPDGRREWLLWIRHWDFNWQGDYRYTKPISLPRGSRLSMRFTYDNSTNNLRNPNHPPQRVAYGSLSRDEMAELWFQVLPHNRGDLDRLARECETKTARVFLEGDEAALRRNPNDAIAHTDLGMACMEQGKVKEAEGHFQAAIRAQPDLALAHYDYGLLLRRQGRVVDAQAEFKEDLRLDAKDFKAHGNLGCILFDQGNLDAAQAEFESALRINPSDSLSRDGLELVAKARAKR